MSRGNQRERDRQKNLKAQQEKGKKNTKSGAEMLREKDRIAQIMREKQEKALARKQAEEAAAKKK